MLRLRKAPTGIIASIARRNATARYLGVEGGESTPARAPEAVSASRPAAAKERSRPIAEVNAEPEADEPQAAPTPEKAITRAVPAPAADQEFAAAAPLSTRWSGMPKTANAINYAPPAASSSYANEQSATDEPDDMPLIWPILTPAELAAARPASRSIHNPDHATCCGLRGRPGTRRSDRAVRVRLVGDPKIPAGRAR